ncbi:MAG: glutamate racemase [Bacteroidetes bacterium]|nr:glutamate racemase [Bacteroidota bacterium]
MATQSLPIGLFDSGIGGLSVARRVMELLPRENTVYFGDTARVPYGSKSAETVIGYSQQAAAFLESLGVKMIIIACNTASAVALKQVQSMVSVPVIGVIEPGAQAAIAQSRSHVIGVIGTEGTVRSHSYQHTLMELAPGAHVYAQACPVFVSLAEEGLDHHPATLIMTREYLAPLLARSIDTLIMGCTHYPLLAPSIQEVAGPNVTLIDPGVATAMQAHATLAGAGMLNDSDSAPRHDYYLSDLPHKFIEVGSRFLGKPLHHVHRVMVDDLTKSV